MRYVTDLIVLEGANAEPPSGWTKIKKDLNAGAGGTYLYFAYEEGDDLERALRDIRFLVGKDSPAPHGYTKIDVDLNQGAKGKYIYAAFTREPSVDGRARDPILALDVDIEDHAYNGDDLDLDREPPYAWNKILQDLNEDAGGKFIYLRYKTTYTDPRKVLLEELERRGKSHG